MAKWQAYIPGDGHWNIPGEHSSTKAAQEALMKMLGLKELPAGTQIAKESPIYRMI